MFYSQFILAKKGPLGTIWIAAHLERKLRKNQVADTDIGVSVDSILCPDVPIALRLSSHLLLGVVRIYSRKVNYLFDDCSEALLKVKQAFRSAAVDLPPEQSKAPYHSITLPETFDLDDFELPDDEIFQGKDRHVSTREQITLQDTMHGVAFPTSQFGPDERFGDGDASQIGLDLDEDLFMEKGDAAGGSDLLNMEDADQCSLKEATSVKDDEHTERISDLPLDSSTNYFSIQAPSTPGLMEEPNLLSVQEAMVSDDHLDEEQNIPELGTKEVSGTASCQVEQPNHEFNSNKKGHHLDEKENEVNEQLKSQRSTLSNEAVEVASHGKAQPLMSIEHIEVINGVDSVGDKRESSPLQNNGIVAADSQSTGGQCQQHEADMNRSENIIFNEFREPITCVDGGKSDPDIRSENNSSIAAQELISCEESENIVVNNGYQCQKTDLPCQSLKNSETSESNRSDKSSVFKTPVLKPCNLHNHNASEVENFPDASRLSAENDGLCSLGLSSKQDVTNDTEILTDVHDGTMPAPKVDQIAHEGADITSNSDRPLDDDSLGDYQLKNESNSKVGDFSVPEKLLSMPYVPAGQPDNVLPECTPGLEVVADHGDRIEVLAGDGDASFENLLSGKKRNYTESTITIQSLNSAVSSGATQSKQAGELVPEDDDLLSSILGGRSTAFKLKPTPPVTDSSFAKRQRASARSSSQKRKVLMDDSMVLHGDMIREQLTNTEDIRRVRKKAPCTYLEVWLLQKQFLEYDIFSGPVFTGLPPEFRCLHSHPHDLRGIKIVQDDGGKGMNDTDDMATQERDGLENTPFKSESVVVIDALQKELETFDNEVAKQMSKHDVPVKKPETANENQSGGEGDQPMIEGVLSSDIDGFDPSRQSINQDCHMDLTREENSRMEEVSGSGRQHHEEVHVNVDCDTDGKSSLEKREGVVSADTTVGVTEDVQGTCSSPVLDIPVTDSVDLEGRAPSPGIIMEECSIEEARFENEEEIITCDIRRDDSCPISNNFVEEDVKLDPTHTVETELSVQGTRMYEKEDLQNLELGPMPDTIPLDIPTEINNPADQCVDPSHIIETNLGFQDPKLNEKEDLRSLEMEQMLITDPIAIPYEFSAPADQGAAGAEVHEHDTEFLNVDDDDVDEDFEKDTQNPEEKRMLDNSGWSSRTRAVANYLQVLFVKEAPHAKKAIPLESLLVGKTRKEASRMFFETLVLKTKDYIGAEQDKSFCEITIKSTGKLMKSEF